jgi:hypothetical protein
VIRIIAISGDGIGAGKSTLAARLGDEVWSLAGALREELAQVYPGYNWWNRTQEYKASTLVPEYGEGKTLRDVLIEYGQGKCATDPCYFVKIIARKLEAAEARGEPMTIAIDDLRKKVEIDYLRGRFGKQLVLLHLDSSTAEKEPHFDNEFLSGVADYHISWQPKKTGGA